jgi:hypothetical protein
VASGSLHEEPIFTCFVKNIRCEFRELNPNRAIQCSYSRFSERQERLSGLMSWKEFVL